MLRRRLPILIALAIGAFAIPAFAAPYVIEHSSMAPSVRPGEVVLVDAAIPRLLGYERGEIVVFQPPAPGYVGPPFIKRIVGLPGETVSIHDGVVYVDGARLDEPYVPAGEATTVDGGTASWVVPASSVFVLGDNRADSWDSRGYGPVAMSAIAGEAWIGFGPTISLGMIPSSAPVLRR